MDEINVFSACPAAISICEHVSSFAEIFRWCLFLIFSVICSDFCNFLNLQVLIKKFNV